MPFYLAIPRKTGSGSGAGTGRSQYQRTSPSRLVITVLSRPVSWPASVLISDLGFLAFCRQKAYESGPQIISSLNRRPFFPNLHLNEAIPIHHPDLMVQFKGAIPDSVQSRIEELGGTLERFPQLGNKEAYLIRNPTGATYREALQFPNVNHLARPPFDAITPDGAMAMYTIATRITAGASLTNVISRVNAGEDREVYFQMGSDAIELDDDTLQPVNPEVDMEGPSGKGKGPEEGEVTGGDKSSWWDRSRGSYYKLFLQKPDIERVYGDASAIPVGPGLFLPFESNYSQPDEGAINLFLSRFYRISVQDSEETDKELDDLMRYWVVEIANTRMGQYLAHMITTLDLALRGGLGVFFIFRADATYEGAILRGEFTLKQVGLGGAASCSATELVADIATYGFHATSVREIVQIVDPDHDPTMVSTLRGLREIVMRNGMPSGQTKNRVEKLLQSVSFNEKPMTLTFPSFETVFTLLSDPAGEIPRDLYLHRNDFFSEMRTQLILSAFGDRIPCLSYGGVTRLRASRKTGKSTSDIPARPNDPPSTFQFKTIPMAGALPLWNAMMQTGIIATDTTTRINGSRVLTGPVKVKLWTSLADFLDATVVEKGTVPEIPARRVGDEGQKRKQTDEGAEDRKKRMRSFF
jgi:hypothetical protein